MKDTGKRPLTSNELKKLQLEMMDEIDEFCRKNKIQYYLIGGTLLGAIRHSGYIPWDDDIDIILFRDDYEKLLKSFVSESGNTQIIQKDNVKNYNYLYAKAIHTKTVLIESDIRHAIGVNIDIFSLDSMPEIKEDCEKIVRKVKFYKDILTLKYLRYRKGRNIWKNTVVFLCRYILKIIPDRFLINKGYKLFIQYHFNTGSKLVANLGGAWGAREIFYRTDFLEAIEIDFEKRKYYIPKGYERILTSLYGDYMKLPPVEKRVTHHGFEAYWK